MSAQKLAEKSAEIILGKDKFNSWLGTELIEIKPGKAVLKMTVRKDMLNGFNRCHGGIIFSLADSAFGFASNTGGEINVAVENSITYLKSVNEGDSLIADAEEISSGKTTGVYDITVSRTTGEKVALFRGLVYKTKKEFLNNNES
jgi:acyl-CoA thioesterase